MPVSKHLLILFLTGTVLPIFGALVTHTDDVCPGSKAWKSAKCRMKVSFSNDSCEYVELELMARLAGENGWIDPHNHGEYKLINSYPSQSSDGSNIKVIEGSRLTGDRKYTDLFRFFLQDVTSGCEVEACSQSQVFSILDFSTNFCNLRSLYCNSSDSCPISHADLEYEETHIDCWQRKASNCISNLTTE